MPANPMVPTPRFVAANVATDRDRLIEINVEYVSWVLSQIEVVFGVPAAQVVGMTADEYVPAVIDKVCGAPPPKGIFYLVNVDDRLAAMGGLRLLGDGVGEIKRIYVRPGFRGMKLGDRILTRLVADARAFGYRRLHLDTAPFMKAAQLLYEAHGFTERPPYEGVEVPPEFHARWRFMQREL